MTQARVFAVRTLLTGAISAIAIGALTIGLTACTPTAPGPTPSSGGPTESGSATPTASTSPEPLTRPALDELELGPDGFAHLRIGEPASADPATSLVTFDPTGCSGAGLWSAHPSYATSDPNGYGPGTAFSVTDAASGGPTGEITRIDLNSGDIPTTEGIRFGSTRAQVEAAYPGVTVVEAILTDIYVVPGTTGQLLIEVASDPGYWAGFRPDETVVYIHASLASDGVFSVAASENVLGVCFE